MEHHDVVVECAKLSVFSKYEVNTPCFSTSLSKKDSNLKRFIGEFLFVFFSEVNSKMINNNNIINKFFSLRINFEPR